MQEAIEKTDSSGKLLPEMVSGSGCIFAGSLTGLRAWVSPQVLSHQRVITDVLLSLDPCLLACSQILICQNLRNNLQHPNEYIRGVTLRFLCRIREEEILEPLVPSILANLEHRHSYVRRNAVVAVNCIYKLPKGELLLQDAPETIEKVLRSEQDLSTKRNAFLMLTAHAHDRAVK